MIDPALTRPSLQDVRDLAHAHPELVHYAVDGRQRITDWNASAERLFGWTRAEAIGRNAMALLVPADQHEALDDNHAAHTRLEDEARSYRLEVDNVDRAGRRFPTEARVYPVGDPGAMVWHAFTSDVSDRHRAAPDRRLAAIVGASADAIVAVDEDRIITDWNPAAERLFGWRRAAMIGMPVDVIVPSGLREQSRSAARVVGVSEGWVRVETRRLRRDGSLVDVELTLTTLGDPERPLACSATYRDVSERLRAERRLLEQTARLRAHSRAETGTAGRSVAAAGTETAAGTGAAGGTGAARGTGAAGGTGAEAPASEADPAEPGAPGGAGSVAAEPTTAEEETVARVLALAREELGMEIAWLEHLQQAHPAGSGTVAVTSEGEDAHGALRLIGGAGGSPPGERELAILRLLAGVIADQLASLRRAAARSRNRAEVTALGALLAALQARDNYTGEHSQAVVDVAVRVARTLGVPAAECEAVGQVALLHDLGKVGIPDAVLHKAGPLGEVEWDLMREHPAIGARILAAIAPLAHLAPAVRAEHERWDGHGYPDGLAGEGIPLAARITFACDAYHAMVSDRPYRRALPHEVAVARLREAAGTQFDPAVVPALLHAIEGHV